MLLAAMLGVDSETVVFCEAAEVGLKVMMTRKTAATEVMMTRKTVTTTTTTTKMMTRNGYPHVFWKYCRSGVPVSEYDTKKPLPEHHDELGELCSPMLAVSAWLSMLCAVTTDDSYASHGLQNAATCP